MVRFTGYAVLVYPLGREVGCKAVSQIVGGMLLQRAVRSWIVEISTDSDWGNEGNRCEVSVGDWNTTTGWYEILLSSRTIVTWDTGMNIMTVLLQTESGTVYQGDYLALKIKNSDTILREIDPDGRSSLRSPDTDPGYPNKEMAAGILFGPGLASILVLS